MRRVFLPLAMLMMTLTFSCLIGCGSGYTEPVEEEKTIEQVEEEMKTGGDAVKEAMKGM